MLCMDISHQLMATEAILNKANKEILTAHLKSCVTNAKTDEEREEKVDELVAMLQNHVGGRGIDEGKFDVTGMTALACSSEWRNVSVNWKV